MTDNTCLEMLVTADLARSMYPLYSPIARVGFTELIIMSDLVARNLIYVCSPSHEVLLLIHLRAGAASNHARSRIHPSSECASAPENRMSLYYVQ